MAMIKKYKVVVVLALAVLAGGVLFLARMYRRDTQALEGFAASYENFDRAMADFSVNQSNDTEVRAIDALAELHAKSDFPLSSLVKNDALIPPAAHEIWDLSGKELYVLDAYQSAIKNKRTDVDWLAPEYGDLAAKRKAAYARFQRLAEIQ